MTAKDLKASILQLAIQGKLVPQDPNDEPASALLARIRDSRVEVENGRATSMKSPRGRGTRPACPPITDDDLSSVALAKEEKPFDLPEGWAWCRLGEVADVLAGYPFEGKGYSKEGVKICGGLIIMPNEIKWQECKRWPTDEGLEDFLLSEGDIVVALDRPWISDGAKVGLIRSQDLPCLLIQRTARIRSKVVLPAYLMLMLKLPMLKQHCNITEMTVPHISHKDIETYSIPLPPLAEQKRIVAKIEELMPMVERYGAVKEQSDALEAALPDAFRKSVLQYAIQGKLVPQDPNDEPASALLARIADNRHGSVGADPRAARTRKSKSSTKSLPPVTEDEQPFDLPEGWAWARLGDVADIIRGSGIKRDEVTAAGVQCVRYGELYTDYKNKIKITEVRSFTSKDVAAKAKRVVRGDLLVTLTGENKEEIGMTVAYLGDEELVAGGDLAIIHQQEIDPVFLSYFMSSAFAISQKANASNGDIIVHLSAKSLSDLKLPLPPLAEQKRIVAEVERLLALGEYLKVAVK